MRAMYKILLIVATSILLSLFTGGWFQRLLDIGYVSGDSIGSVGSGLEAFDGVIFSYIFFSAFGVFLFTSRIKYAVISAAPALILVLFNPGEKVTSISIIILIVAVLVAWTILFLKKLFTKP